MSLGFPFRGSPQDFKTRLLGEGFHTLINGDLSSLGFPFRASPQDFKTRLLGEGFHTLTNGGLFSSPTNVGHHSHPPTLPSG